jgi:hypothetical protein
MGESARGLTGAGGIIPRAMLRRCLALACVLGAAPVLSAQQPVPSLEVVLERFREYLTSYSQAYAGTVATEIYIQHVNDPKPRSVRLESEFAMVRVPGSDEWLGFRDVQRIDRKDVTGRRGRLADLFANPAGLSLVVASRIAEESARFNIGPSRRTVNNPAIVLEILDPRHHKRFRFARGGAERIGGIRAWVIRIDEQSRPTIVRSSRGLDEPVSGRVWVDPETGTLLRAALRITVDHGASEFLHMDVTFGLESQLQMWVPVRLRELHEVRTRHLQTGQATYVDYRQFVVQSRILPP